MPWPRIARALFCVLGLGACAQSPPAIDALKTRDGEPRVYAVPPGMNKPESLYLERFLQHSSALGRRRRRLSAGLRRDAWSPELSKSFVQRMESPGPSLLQRLRKDFPARPMHRFDLARPEHAIIRYWRTLSRYRLRCVPMRDGLGLRDLVAMPVMAVQRLRVFFGEAEVLLGVPGPAIRVLSRNALSNLVSPSTTQPKWVYAVNGERQAKLPESPWERPATSSTDASSLGILSPVPPALHASRLTALYELMVLFIVYIHAADDIALLAKREAEVASKIAVLLHKYVKNAPQDFEQSSETDYELLYAWVTQDLAVRAFLHNDALNDLDEVAPGYKPDCFRTQPGNTTDLKAWLATRPLRSQRFGLPDLSAPSPRRQ